MSKIQDCIADKVAEAAIKKLDIEAIAKAVSPKIQTAIIKDILFQIEDIDWGDYFVDSIPEKELKEYIREQFLKMMNKKARR